ncbi:MAG: hypothetical protein AAF431_11745 [Pseudomonadota bacterium]
MSSTHNNEYRQTIEQNLAMAEERTAKFESKNAAAQFSLYYAQGATERAVEDIAQIDHLLMLAQQTNQQAVQVNNSMDKLLTTTENIDTGVAAAVSSASTAAANMQTASTAIAQLAADIGAAVALVTEMDLGTEIIKLINQTNKLITKTTYNAERASLSAMQGSVDASEIIASQVAKEASELSEQIASTLKLVSTELETLTAQDVSAGDRFAANARHEKKAEGDLANSMAKLDASAEQIKQINQRLNYALTANSTPAAEQPPSVSVRFRQYNDPFASAPLAGARYFLLFAPADQRELITLEQAESLFTSSEGDEEPLFYPVDLAALADGELHWQRDIDATRYLSENDSSRMQAGSTYVVFLYIQLPEEYKKLRNDFDDVLSAPSQPVTPSYLLPIPEQVSLSQASSSDQLPALEFSIADEVPAGTQFRCILLPDELVDEHVNTQERALGEIDAGFLFNLAIAEQIPAASYSVAQQTDAHTDYRAELRPDSQDNFGNLLVPGKPYFAVVLAVFDYDQAEAVHLFDHSEAPALGRYTSNMSPLTANPVHL